MTNIKNKKLSLILSLLLLIVAVFTFCFTLVPNQNKTFNADTVETTYSFHASDFYTFTLFDYGSIVSSLTSDDFLFSCDFSQSSDGKSILFDPNYFTFSIAAGSSDELGPFRYNSLNYFNVYLPGTPGFFNPDYIYEDSFVLTPGSYTVLFNVSYSFIVDEHIYYQSSISFDDGFNCNVYKVEISLSDTFVVPIDVDGVKSLHISYYDVNDKILTFEFYVPSNYIYSTRTYYFVQPDDFTDSQIYNQGYQDGLAANQQDIYKNGYKDGQTVGYANGYSAGAEAANEYTFLSLMGSVLDAPLQTFTSLLNFNLLGVNILSFITGLLTLAVVVFVVKLCLGGK